MGQREFDLDERLLWLAVEACRMARTLQRDPLSRHLAGQLFRSATSPASNYAEARAAESRRDFVHKMRVCLKELRETQVWLRLIEQLESPKDPAFEKALQECDELVAIFAKSVATASKSLKPGSGGSKF